MFIIDSNNQLIAADAADLARWGVQDIYEAARNFRKGDLRLERELSRLTLPSGEDIDCRIESMESLLGSWSLCTIAEAAETSTAAVAVTEEPKSPETSSPTEDEELLAILPLEESGDETPAENRKESTSPSSEEESAEEELFSLSLDEDELRDKEGSRTDSRNGPTSLAVDEEETPEELISLATEEEGSREEPLSLSLKEEPRESEEVESLEEEVEEFLKISGEEEEPAVSLMSTEEETEAQAVKDEIVSLPPEEEVPDTEETAEGTGQTPLFTLQPETEPTPWEKIEAEFHPDLHANAERIELTAPEYAELLKDFVHDSRSMHSQLLDADVSVRKNAAAVLKDAVSLLHLHPLDRLLGMLEEASVEDRKEIVNAYERLLGQLEVMLISLESTASPERSETQATPGAEAVPAPETPAAPVEEPIAEETPLPETEALGPAPEPAAPTTEEAPEKEEFSITPDRETPPAVAKISVEEFLKGVKPVPIEFSLQIASEELNLPEDLVLEFVSDFDKQGHEYLSVLIDDYQKKDLDHLQKTAHMLKGAASNLRIEAMVDNLYDLQFDSDIERAPQRIRLFAGQLMSLDNYLQQMQQK
jgi:HPt (histidine-containing phosphotransfer) domain-containing protein